MHAKALSGPGTPSNGAHANASPARSRHVKVPKFVPAVGGGGGVDVTAEGADPYQPRLDPTHTSAFFGVYSYLARSDMTQNFRQDSEIICLRL